MIHTPTNLALKSKGIYVRSNFDEWQHQWPVHTHLGLEVYLFIQGNANYVIEDDIYELLPGDMLLFSGDVIHRVNPSKDVRYVRSYVNFMPSFLEEHVPPELYSKLLSLFDSPNGLRIRWSPDEREEMERFFNSLSQEMEREAFGHNYMLKTQLTQMLLCIYRKSKHLIEMSPNQQHSPIQVNVRRILQSLNQNFTETISLDELAKMHHLSKYYMCHSFKEVTGYTINSYVMQKRVEEAKKMLLTKDDSISSISEKLGFNTTVHFSRTFKQYAGASPQMYRKISADC
ncbi:Bifunctional transcriptional activator/DNA repair enzyme AdaA [compost metagenome]